MMKINIFGNGSFGTFLKQELPNFGFTLDEFADTVILAVPFSAYESAGEYWGEKEGKFLINVCSVQLPSTEILLKYSKKITSIHPLFGARTPADKRNTIVTYTNKSLEEDDFLNISDKFFNYSPKEFTPEIHDKLMARTHFAAVLAAKQAKHFVDAAADVPDELIPNSFRLLRNFVKTLEDCPSGTVESIMANPFI